MPSPLNLVTALTPGTYITENQAGAIPAELASHSAVYMLGFTTRASAPKGTPRLLASLADFENVYGSDTESKSHAAVKLFFRQRPGVGLYFLNVPATLAYPDADDIATALQVFSKEDPQGFLLAPEFFQESTGATEHTAIATVLESHASDPRMYWVALIDSAPATVAQTEMSAYVSALVDERANLTSPLGHSWYCADYGVDLDDNVVPASVWVAGIAIRRNRAEGYHQPPAGVKYPVFGLKALKHYVGDVQQDALNPIGVNVTRRLPKQGICVWGARTLSTLPTYRYANNRVICNVLAGTARDAYDQLVLSALDGLGVTFAVAKATTVSFLEIMRQIGALYGASPDEAYRVICDASNNPGALLDAGQLNVDVYFRCASTLEFVGVRLNKVGLATPLSSLFASDDLAALEPQNVA